jgi:hypothetical protein
MIVSATNVQTSERCIVMVTAVAHAARSSGAACTAIRAFVEGAQRKCLRKPVRLKCAVPAARLLDVHSMLFASSVVQMRALKRVRRNDAAHVVSTTSAGTPSARVAILLSIGVAHMGSAVDAAMDALCIGVNAPIAAIRLAKSAIKIACAKCVPIAASSARATASGTAVIGGLARFVAHASMHGRRVTRTAD